MRSVTRNAPSAHRSVHYRRGIRVNAEDVIAYCDRLEENFMCVTGGNRIRALCMAIVSVEISVATGGDALARHIDGGLPVLDATLVLLRDRLTAVTSERIRGR